MTFLTGEDADRILPLVQRVELCPLGPGVPNEAMRPLLEALTVENVFRPTVLDRDMASACIAGLWLFHNFLDESHRISQSIDTVTGSYWHGIMHRREPDFSNAKYWFRRVGSHPVFEPLCESGKHLALALKNDSVDFLRTQTCWDPFRFIDLCEACLEEKSPRAVLCSVIADMEWKYLFDYCHCRSVGTKSKLGFVSW